jgi:hypothetical protein
MRFCVSLLSGGTEGFEASGPVSGTTVARRPTEPRRSATMAKVSGLVECTPIEESGDDASQSERGSEVNPDSEQNGRQAMGNHHLQYDGVRRTQGM